MSGWPNRCKLDHAFLREYSYKRLKLAQLLGQLGVFLTCIVVPSPQPVQLEEIGVVLDQISLPPGARPACVDEGCLSFVSAICFT